MVTVDAEGRISVPEELRERLGLTPGTSVTVTEEDGQLVVRPEREPADVLERMEELVAETASAPSDRRAIGDRHRSQARRHRWIVRDGAGGDDSR